MTTKPTTSWRDLIKVHPAAEMFPLMPPEELKVLGEDIKANGLTEPVTTWVDQDGAEWLLDGRNRLDAIAPQPARCHCYAGYRFSLHGQLIGSGARKGQREPERFKVLPPSGSESRWAVSYTRRNFGSDPYAYVVSANIHRRHLTTEQRKEIAAGLLKSNPERSDRSVAKEVGLHNETVAAVRKAGEASDEIRHIPPTERVDTGGRKRARKTANEHAKAETAEEQIEAVGQRQERKSAAAKEQLAEVASPQPVEVALGDPISTISLPAAPHGVDHLATLLTAWDAAPADVRE